MKQKHKDYKIFKQYRKGKMTLGDYISETTVERMKHFPNLKGIVNNFKNIYWIRALAITSRMLFDKRRLHILEYQNALKFLEEKAEEIGIQLFDKNFNEIEL